MSCLARSFGDGIIHLSFQRALEQVEQWAILLERLIQYATMRVHTFYWKRCAHQSRACGVYLWDTHSAHHGTSLPWHVV